MSDESAAGYTVGGPVQAGAGLYIPRPADDELLALCRSGTFAYVLAPHQCGKSSLLVRTAARLADEDVRSAIVDLAKIGIQVEAEGWYFGLLYEICRQLRLEGDLPAWWQEHAGLDLTERLTRFFDELLLREIGGRVVIFVDGIETTRSLPFTDSFYAAIRACYDARARGAAFRRLSFVLSGAGTPGDLIRDPQRTPFNSGRRVALTNFTLEEARPLAAGLGLPGGEARRVLGWVLEWTGGHPYLTQRLCQALAEEHPGQWTAARVARVVRNRFLGDRNGQDNHLSFARDRLTRRARVARTVFDDQWVRAHLPPPVDQARRLRVAVGVLITLFVLTLGAGGVGLLAQRDEAARQALAAAAAGALAEARALAVRAQVAAGADPELGLLLAIEAGTRLAGRHAVDDSGLVERVLREMVAASHVRLRLTHPDAVTDARWSPDGRRVLTLSADGGVRIWAAAAGTDAQDVLTDSIVTGATWSPDSAHVLLTGYDKLSKEHRAARIWDVQERGSGAIGARPLGRGQALAAAWSPDGRRALTVEDDGQVYVWDASSAGLLTSFAAGAAGVSAGLGAVWSADGARILTFGPDGLLRLWAAATGRAQPGALPTGAISGALLSPDGRQVLTFGGAAGGQVWDLATGAKLAGLSAPLAAAQWSPDGRRLLTVQAAPAGGPGATAGGADPSRADVALVWDATTGSVLFTLRGHTGALAGAAWSPDGGRIVTAGKDGTARVWDAASGNALLTLLGHTGPLNAAAWSPDGGRIVTASDDTTARIWEPIPGVEQLATRAAEGPAAGAVWSPQGERMLTRAGGTVEVWSAISGTKLLTLPGRQTLVADARWSPDGTRIFTAGSAGNDSTLLVWDAGGGGLLQTLRGPTEPIAGAAWDPASSRRLLGFGETRAWIWDAVGTLRATLLPGAPVTGPPPAAMLRQALWSPDGTQVLTAGAGAQTWLWSAADGQPLRILADPAGVGTQYAEWNANSHAILTVDDQAGALVWAAAPPAPGGPVGALAGGAGPVRLATWAPDGTRILAVLGAGPTAQAQVWDTAGTLLLTLHGRVDALQRAVWNHTGTRILGIDGRARVWDARTPAGSGQELFDLRDNENDVLTAAWSPDDRQILVLTRDGILRLYAADATAVLALAQTRVTRALSADERAPFAPLALTPGPDGSPVAPAAPTPAPPPGLPGPAPALGAPAGFADPAFLHTWERTDGPVLARQTDHSWYWGDLPGSALREPYRGAPGGERLVQYFDKGRMEITNPAGDPSGPSYVTNGALATELMLGRVQVGAAQYEARCPAGIPVAGDAGDSGAPTYATLGQLMNAPHAAQLGRPVLDAIDRAGLGPADPARAGVAGIAVAYYEPATGRNIPRIFWDFLNARGPIDVAGQPAQGRLNQPWWAASGLPLTDAYWARVGIAGRPQNVLVQAYERRVLLYVPAFAAPFAVQWGNVGQHYYTWRYRSPDCAPPPLPPPPTGTPTRTPPASATATATPPPPTATATPPPPTATPTPTPTPTPPGPPPTVTPLPTATPTPSATPTLSPTPTGTATPTQSPTRTPRPTATPPPSAPPLPVATFPPAITAAPAAPPPGGTPFAAQARATPPIPAPPPPAGRAPLLPGAPTPAATPSPAPAATDHNPPVVRPVHPSTRR